MTLDRSRRRAAFTRLLRGLAGVAAGLVLLYLLVERFSSRDQLLDRIRALPPSAVAAAAALSLVAFVLSVVRWRVVLASMGIEVPFASCLRAVLAAWPVAAVSPARAGDAVRAVALLGEAPAVSVVGSVVLEKVFDLHSLAVLLCVGALASGRPIVGLAALAAVVAFWLVFAIAPRIARWQASRIGGRLERVSRALASVADGLESVRRRPSQVAAIVSLSVVGWLLSTWIIRVLLTAAGQELRWGALLLIWSAATLATAVPIGISGIGPRDGTFLLVGGWIVPDLDPAAAMAATLVYPAIASGIYAVIGLPVLVGMAARPSANSE